MMFHSTLLLAVLQFVAAADDSPCDKYTKALFKDNTEENQFKLLKTLVNTVVAGNFTPTTNGKVVPGILAKGSFGGEDINLAPFFTGEKGKTANIQGKAMEGVKFFDNGGVDPLLKGMPGNDPNSPSRQVKLMNHLYQVFGSLTGCSKQGGDIFPNYAGNPSMTDVHKFMGLRKADIGYFNDMVGQAAIGLGVTEDDATAIGKSLNSLFNIECSAPAQLTPKEDPKPQGFCLDKSCDVGDKSQCAPDTVAPAVDDRQNREVDFMRSKLDDGSDDGTGIIRPGGRGGNGGSGNNNSGNNGGSGSNGDRILSGDRQIFGRGGVQRVVKCVPRSGSRNFMRSEL